MDLRAVRCSVFFVLLMVIICGTALHANAQRQLLRVGINDRHSESAVMISPLLGKYRVTDEEGDTLYHFRSDDVVSIQAVGDSLVVRGVYGLDRRVAAVHVSCGDTPSSFLVKLGRDGREFKYSGNLSITVRSNDLTLVNTVDMDTYVSHVVQSEAGHGATDGYYQIQSIISRTYAMGNLNRHSDKGFDVCDHQHCQVYDGKTVPDSRVVTATASTSGIVMADSTMRPILATFHANCGGQTANSEDVWSEPRSYLVAVKDTFCTDQRSATWEERIPLGRFKEYFGPMADGLLVDGFLWMQPERMAFLVLDGQKFRLADIRRDLRLRSTYFDFEVKGEEVLFTGRGFGHGVGLCQQGAIRMAREGLTYSEILGHYYKGVSLVNISALR